MDIQSVHMDILWNHMDVVTWTRMSYFKTEKEPVYHIQPGWKPTRRWIQEGWGASHSRTQTGLVSWPSESQQVSLFIHPK